jgi:hypothetical protein
MYMNKRGQTWSMDIVLAVVIFGFISVSITSFALLDEPDTDSLQRTAQSVDSRLDSPFIGCNATISNGVIDKSAIECLSDKSYADVKKEINADGNFCIFLEDEEGKIIPIKNKTGIGGEEITVGGKPCGQI